ncbi:MAG: sugar ABC transporter permease [Anaerolineaceae bacterium]|nr:sugar ABC transporter permease [Anaerolineaceae bacterium]
MANLSAIQEETKKKRIKLRWRDLSDQRRKEAITGILFILPWLIGFLFFYAGPALISLGMSFTRWNIVSDPIWIGLDNYIEIFTGDKNFWNSVFVTFKYAGIYIPLITILSIITAMALNSKIRGIAFFRTLFYLPTIAPAIAASLIFMWILQPTYGLFNILLSYIGIDGPNWFKDPRYALWGIIMIAMWRLGASAIIYLAGLQNIPEQLYDASDIDGASAWQKFWNVTLPMLSPIVFFQIVVELIGVFQTFTPAYVVSQANGYAGPIKELYFFMLYVYVKGWQNLQMGYASALSWLLTIFILVITILVFRSSPYWVHYEAEKK